MKQLDDILTQQIAAAIRAGGFPHIAAQAFGVGRPTFENWRRLGRHDENGEPFRTFSRDVEEAIGQARLRAEIGAYSDTPKLWLHHGPGRDTPNSPGWAALARPVVRARRERNALVDPDAVAVIQKVFAALGDLPEIRERVALAVDLPKRGDR